MAYDTYRSIRYAIVKFDLSILGTMFALIMVGI